MCNIHYTMQNAQCPHICTVYFEIYSAHFLTCLSSTMYSKYMLQYTVAQEAHIYMLHIIHRGYNLHCLASAWQCIGQKSGCLSPWRIISCRCSRPIPGAWGRYPVLEADTRVIQSSCLAVTHIFPTHCLTRVFSLLALFPCIVFSTYAQRLKHCFILSW